MVPEQAPIIILDRKSDVCMNNNVKEIKHTRHISRIMHLVTNDEECNLHKTVLCEGGLQLADIRNKNVREEKLNPRLGYTMVRIENGQKIHTGTVM